MMIVNRDSRAEFSTAYESVIDYLTEEEITVYVGDYKIGTIPKNVTQIWIHTNHVEYTLEYDRQDLKDILQPYDVEVKKQIFNGSDIIINPRKKHLKMVQLPLPISVKIPDGNVDIIYATRVKTTDGEQLTYTYELCDIIDKAIDEFKEENIQYKEYEVSKPTLSVNKLEVTMRKPVFTIFDETEEIHTNLNNEYEQVFDELTIDVKPVTGYDVDILKAFTDYINENHNIDASEWLKAYLQTKPESEIKMKRLKLLEMNDQFHEWDLKNRLKDIKT